MCIFLVLHSRTKAVKNLWAILQYQYDQSCLEQLHRALYVTALLSLFHSLFFFNWYLPMFLINI